MEKSKGRFSEHNGAKVLAAMMTVLAAVLLAVSWIQTSRLNRAYAAANAAYQKAFYETCELTEAMSVNLHKLLVAGDSGQMQQLLNEITQQAQGSLGNLSMLPMGEEVISGTLKFMNQVGDFTQSLSVHIADGGAIGETEYETIGQLSDHAAAFSIGMANLLSRVESGEALLDADSSVGDESLYPLTNPAAEYPTLLYDGPFSDGAIGGDYKALAEYSNVSAEEAQQSLSAFLGNVSDIQCIGESAAPVDCYEFAVTSNGYPLTAGVTKQGGKVLYVLSETEVTEVNYTAEQLLDTARAFLLSRGFGPMEMSYYSRYDGILTVNYAAVQNDVILYPDLVKVQLSMRDGSIIGAELGNYWMNHVQRTLELPVLTPEEAAARIGGSLTPQSVRLSVIPIHADEALCYEIRATDGISTYLIYIDARTGAERELMQVVSDESGALVM